MIRARGYALTASLLVVACSQSPSGMAPAPNGYLPIPSETQRKGDAARGYDALVNKGYVTCGIPANLYNSVFGAAAEKDLLPGRSGDNANLPYYYTALTAKSGVPIVSANCLTCHAGELNGKVIVGLGAHERNFTTDQGDTASLASLLTNDPGERAEAEKFAARVSAVSPYVQTLTVGTNPADNLTAALFSHRDPETLAWSDTPLMDVPTTVPAPVDVPPWWRMKKKNAMFYNASGRGDHTRIMMAASTLCTDTVAEAQEIDAYFNDVHEYITTLEPPVWPFAVDQTLAAQGKAVFDKTCAECHGTYGETDTYPNLLIPIAIIGTDSSLVDGAAQFADRFVDWWKRSFWGQTSRLEPQLGYVAPPLDGVWATAPFLHNGSVPTIATLLDSTKRPKYWRRKFVSTDYDQTNLGWNHAALEAGHDAVPSATDRALIYDTTQPGYGNSGHTFGDALTPPERTALLEYIKTL